MTVGGGGGGGGGEGGINFQKEQMASASLKVKCLEGSGPQTAWPSVPLWSDEPVKGCTSVIRRTSQGLTSVVR